jgi:OmpA-OmpF porin, OOP family
MSSSTTSSLLSTFDSRSIGEIASRFGQSEEAVAEGLESSMACLLGALGNKAGDTTFMSGLFKLVSQAPSNINVSDLMGAVTDPSRASSATSSLLSSGQKLLSLVFGGGQSSIIDAIGGSSGLRPGMVTGLMSMAAPMMMSALGRLVRNDRMNPAGLGSLLASESEGVRDLLPAGVSNMINAAPATVTPSTRPIALGAIPEVEALPEEPTIEPPTAKSRGFWWLIPLLLLPALIYWGYRARHPVIPVAPQNLVIVRTVPRNVFVNIPTNGAEARFLAFIRDPSKGVEPPTWFDFDQLLFNTDSATLRPESQRQLRNIALILRAYPNVRLQIGGFSDNSGNAPHNLKLSQDRANGVMAQLVALGISPDRLEAQGYGEQSPLMDNSTAVGRAKNRRASIRVTQK